MQSYKSNNYHRKKSERRLFLRVCRWSALEPVTEPAEMVELSCTQSIQPKLPWKFKYSTETMRHEPFDGWFVYVLDREHFVSIHSVQFPCLLDWWSNVISHVPFHGWRFDHGSLAAWPRLAKPPPWKILHSRDFDIFSLVIRQAGCRTATSRKRAFSTGSRGAFVPDIKPVQKIRDKSPPPLVPIPYEPVLKAPPRGLPGECRLGTFGTGL
jgi:hypothetical protein